MSFKTTQPFEIDYVVRQWLTTRLEKKIALQVDKHYHVKIVVHRADTIPAERFYPYVHDTRTRNRRWQPVPENRYYKPARKYSMLPETGIPEKFGTKLHARRVRNRYRFFWYRLLAPTFGECIMGIKPRFMWLITSWSLVSATSKL